MSDSANPWTAARQASCPSPTPRAYSNSCPLSQWCHPTISSSVVPFSSRLLSFPTSGSFLMRIKQVIILSHHRCINKHQFPPTDLQAMPRWVDFSWSRVGVFFKMFLHLSPAQGFQAGFEYGVWGRLCIAVSQNTEEMIQRTTKENGS